ncbi:MAG: hypothetical protein M1826_002039 [Phylliscum demangeonii]|nr:MAG: hypothetical protein M1826_002039 [Phylliscum demangeonii]
MPIDEVTGKRRVGRPSRVEVAARSYIVPALSSRLPILRRETKQIAPETVNAKWVNLSESSQEQVRALFRAVARPVLVHQRDDDERRAEVQAGLDALLSGMEHKLPRFPFPPDTKDEHFDFEKLLAGNRAIEGQLTPTIHSIGLLRDVIRQERVLLESDRLRLQALEREVGLEQSIRGKAGINAHPLLLDLPDEGAGSEDDAESIGLIHVHGPAERPLGVRMARGYALRTRMTLTQDMQDDEDTRLAPVLTSLMGRLNRVQDDLDRAYALDDALLMTRAAVDEWLHRELIPEQYLEMNA